jgi:hypothetical protein
MYCELCGGKINSYASRSHDGSVRHLYKVDCVEVVKSENDVLRSTIQQLRERVAFWSGGREGVNNTCSMEAD